MVDMALELQNITHHYGELEVLKNVSLRIRAGETVALTGASGSGKSTLLQIAGLLDASSEGRVHICGEQATTDAARTRLRRNMIGFVYQFHHLLPEFSALENALMPLHIAGRADNAAREKAHALLEKVGLSNRAHHRPAELSGGERQRVAIVRSMIHAPKLILADEPTGNLDERNAQAIFEAFIDLAKQSGAAILIATHNPNLAQQLSATYHLHLGHIEKR